jgi:transcriptional antiterminator RfaH
MRDWYITYTRPRAEKQIAIRLEKAGIPFFLPLQKELRQWSDRKKWVERPLFPSYIFVNVDKKEYYLTLGIPGMLYYVNIKGNAVALTDSRMQDIKRAIESNKEVEVLSGAPVPGDVITIKRGALKGLKGTVIHYEGQHHLLMAIEELGKYLKIKIQPDEL